MGLNIPARLTSLRVRQLELFLRLAEVKTISEAARKCHVTQPTATEMLKKLEGSFGTKLFVRSSQGITLTAQGERVARRVALSLRELETATEEARLSGGRGEILNVGFIPNAMSAGLSDIIALFVASFPAIQLRLKELNVANCASAVLSGEVDIAFTLNHPSFSDVDSDHAVILAMLGEDRFIPYQSTKLQLPDDADLPAATLREMPWILPTSDSFIRQAFDNWFIQHGVAPPNAVLEITPMVLSAELLRATPCLALLPTTFAGNSEHSYLQPLQSVDFEIVTRIVVASRQSQTHRQSVLDLLSCVEAVS